MYYMRCAHVPHMYCCREPSAMVGDYAHVLHVYMYPTCTVESHLVPTTWRLPISAKQAPTTAQSPPPYKPKPGSCPSAQR